MRYPDRVGVTSRIAPGRGRKRTWRIDDQHAFPLPVVIDLMDVDPDTLEPAYRFEVTVDLVDGTPAITRVEITAVDGLNITRMQREFRWATPLDIVTRSIPRLLAAGIDPFTFDLPVTGFPDAADLRKPSNARLSDVFLEQIAREYLAHGRGLRTGHRGRTPHHPAHRRQLDREGPQARHPHRRREGRHRRHDRPGERPPLSRPVTTTGSSGPQPCQPGGRSRSARR